MHDVQKIKSLSLETAMALFKTKIMPILTYGIEIIGEKLTMANLETLEKVKATYVHKEGDWSLQKHTFQTGVLTCKGDLPY